MPSSPSKGWQQQSGDRGVADTPALPVHGHRPYPHGLRELVEAVSVAVDAGVGMVQLREKDMPAGQLLELAHRLRAVTNGKSLLIVMTGWT